MVKKLPDKWVRDAVYNAINNIIVDGYTIPCYDSRTYNQNKDYYVILSTQSSDVSRDNKCEHQWSSNILIDINTIYDINNTSGRLLADNITDKVRELTNNLELDIESGLTIIDQVQSFPSDLVSTNINTIVYRKFIRIELIIN